MKRILIIGIFLLLMFVGALASNTNTATNKEALYAQYLESLNAYDIASISQAKNKFIDLYKNADYTEQAVGIDQFLMYMLKTKKDFEEKPKIPRSACQIFVEGHYYDEAKLLITINNTTTTPDRYFLETINQNGFSLFHWGEYYLEINNDYFIRAFSQYKIQNNVKDFLDVLTQEEIIKNNIQGNRFDNTRKIIILKEGYLKKYPMSKFVKASLRHDVAKYLTHSWNNIADIKSSYEMYLKKNPDALFYKQVQKAYQELSKKDTI